MASEVEIFENYLRTQNLKHSKPRRDIVEVFLTSEGHLSAQELYEQTRRHNPRIGFATVYRTLKLLEECGLARTMDYGDGTLRYEPDRFQHHHVICTSCNRTVEFLSPELESLLQQVQKTHNFVPQSHAVRVLSVCTDCDRAATASRRRSSEKDLETILSRDALQVAIANEQLGLHFYSRALEVTEDDTTRAVFARLIDEEERHLAALQKEYSALLQAHTWLDDEPALLHFDHERLESIFPQDRHNIGQIVQSAGPIEALFMAMTAERRSYEFFHHYASMVEYPRGRAIFKQFASEEQRHLKMIRHAYHELQEKAREASS
jgi:Fur family ferric uptake transcriptional regulator